MSGNGTDNKLATVIQSENFINQVAMAVPSMVKPERIVRTALTVMRMNPRLFQCTPASIMGCILQSAQLGLEFGTGLAHMVPYKNTATFIPDYKGLVQLMYRSTMVATVKTDATYEGDQFDDGMGDKPIHIKGDAYYDADESKITGFYAAVKIKNGGWVCEWWPKRKVDAHRDKHSPAKNTGPWKTHYVAMAKKTLLKQVAKLSPMSSEMALAVRLDDMAEVGKMTPIDVTIDSSLVADSIRNELAAAVEKKRNDDNGGSEPETAAADPQSPKQAKAPNLRQERKVRFEALADELAMKKTIESEAAAYDELMVLRGRDTKTKLTAQDFEIGIELLQKTAADAESQSREADIEQPPPPGDPDDALFDQG